MPSEYPSVLLRDGQPAGRIHARGPANVLPRDARSSMLDYGTRELGAVGTRYGGGHPWSAGNAETVPRFGRERPGITFRPAGARHRMFHRFRGEARLRRFPRTRPQRDLGQRDPGRVGAKAILCREARRGITQCGFVGSTLHHEQRLVFDRQKNLPKAVVEIGGNAAAFVFEPFQNLL